jgi:hypothetical protein
MRVTTGLPASLLAVRRKLRPWDALVPCAGKDSLPHLIWLNAEGIGSRNNAAKLGDGVAMQAAQTERGRASLRLGRPFISLRRFSLTCVNAPAPHCVMLFLTETRSRAMSWGSYWISPWMFFGPMMTLLVMIVCMAGMFFMMRVGTVHHSSAEIGPIGLSFGFARNSRDNSLTPFEKYRRKTLPRSDQEQRKFQELIDPLRAANGNAKSDRLMAERRSRLLSCG